MAAIRFAKLRRLIGLPLSLQCHLMMCLQIILSNHHPSLLYNINEVYKATKWVLQGTSRTMGLPLTAPPPLSAPTLTTMKIMPDQGYIKTEQLGAFLSEFTNTIVDTLNTNCACPGPIRRRIDGPLKQQMYIRQLRGLHPGLQSG